MFPELSAYDDHDELTIPNLQPTLTEYLNCELMVTTEDNTQDKHTTEDKAQDKPTTEDNTQDEPTTENSTQGEPTTEDNTQDKPTTEDNTQDEPTTEDNTQDKPTTEDNTQGEPTTEANTQDKPTTEDKTQGEPETANNIQDESSMNSEEKPQPQDKIQKDANEKQSLGKKGCTRRSKRKYLSPADKPFDNLHGGCLKGICYKLLATETVLIPLKKRMLAIHFNFTNTSSNIVHHLSHISTNLTVLVSWIGSLICIIF